MKIFKNKFMVILFLLIVGLFAMQFYFVSESFQRDTNSYVTLLQWQGKIESQGKMSLLKVQEKVPVIQGDTITTIWEDSLAIIEWGDKSITRMWGNSKVEIRENFVGKDLGKINISFELLRGKTWSNVVTIMWENSYFKQEIKDNVAAVRGTVYEADYEKDFIFVHNHEVSVTGKDWAQIKITSGQAISLSNLNLIENIAKLKDTVWEKLNTDLDKAYMEELRNEFMQSFQESNPLNFVGNFSQDTQIYNLIKEGKISQYLETLPEDKKQEVLSKIETFHQMLNFESGLDSEMYTVKLNSRNVLMENSDQQKQELYVRYSLYDLQDMIEQKIDSEVFQQNIAFLGKYQNLMEKNDYSGIFWVDSATLKNILFSSDPNVLFQSVSEKLQKLDAFGTNVIEGHLKNLFNLPK